MRKWKTNSAALAAAIVGLGVSSSANAAIIITEIFYNLSGPEGSNVEWIEIANNGAGPVDISGWVARDLADNSTSGAIPAGTTLASGASAVITQQSAATFQQIWGPMPNVISVSNFFSLANSGLVPPGAIPATPAPAGDFTPATFGGGSAEAIAIVDANAGIVHDVVSYHNAAPWPTGLSVPGAGANGGRSIYVTPAALADAANVDELNNDGASWAGSSDGTNGAYTALIVNPDFADNGTTSVRYLDQASPGVVSGLTIVPEPAGAAAILLAGLVVGRRRLRLI